MPRLKGVFDFVRQPLYDTVTVTVASLPQVTFFQNPIGVGASSWQTAGGTVSKNKADTNLQLGGMIPKGFGYLVQGFRLAVPWNIPGADLKLFLNGCFFEFAVAQKSFLTVPARTLPAGNGPQGTGTDLNSNGFPAMGNMFGLGDDPLPIEENMNFQVTLTWPGTAPTITANTVFNPANGIPVTIYLDGRLGRPVQ